ncbi:hypothetical protein LWI29_005714 [Acer saccharum]|uniref:RNase H type-1 domain-containing protein n=1 Tax=Acer saccharum TaxID=4024 RepID=A0AA39TCW2_ACESA|nr:hypothetical protein LWI29_005714 [Acer saccharum]
MWRIWFNSLVVDERVQTKGVSLVSACDCCSQRQTESIDHIFSQGEIAAQVWSYASKDLGVLLTHNWTWKSRVLNWFRYAKKSSVTGTLIGLIPCLTTWCLWKRRCKVRMEGKTENADQVWRAVRVWIKLLGDNICLAHNLSDHDRAILESFRLQCPINVSRPSKIVKWSRPLAGWIKLNCDGSCRGNPGNTAGGGIIRDSNGMVKGAFSTHYGDGTNDGADLKAIVDGIRLCKKLHLVNIIIESDSKIVVDWICKGRCTLWYLWDFWEDLCRELRGLNYMVAHQFREANSAVDFLA